MSPNTCPKFNQCSAPICPLDPDWNKRVMLRDERICFYITKVKRDPSYEGEEAKAAKAMLVSDQLPSELKRILGKKRFL